MGQSILAFGNLASHEQHTLSTIVNKAAIDLRQTNDAGEAKSWLGEESPRLMLVDSKSSEAERLCLEARSNLEHAHMPIVAIGRGLDDLSFAEVFSWGGDDVISLADPRPLMARLRFLPKDKPPALSQDAGVALVADPDRGRRVVLAHVLRNAGYSVNFAVSAKDVPQYSSDASVKLVIIDLALDPNPASVVAEGRKKNSNAIWIVTCPPKELHEHHKALSGTENAAVTDGFAPPENVVFLANELSRGGASDKRSTRRLLYGTKVAFRAAGRDQDDFGYSYNISEGGLYVRTLAAPDESSVWLELRPPRTDSLIRLEGEVRWRYRFGPASGATVPPGFGVKISDATRACMEAWRYGNAAFAEMLGFPSLKV